MIPTDTSALLAKREAMARQKPYSPEWRSARIAYQNALVSADGLLNELDQLREFKARIESATSNHPDPCHSYNGKGIGACGWKRAYADVLEALAIPAECEYVGTGLKPGMKYYASVNGGEPQEYTSGQAPTIPAEGGEQA